MSAVTQLVRPPAPEPRPTSLVPVALLRALQKNPIECWAEEHFEQPVVTATRAIGHVLVINDPGAIRRVLLDNASNYRQDTLQHRVLSAGLANGLPSAEDEQWRVQRQTFAPTFSRKTVAPFAPAMRQAGNAPVERWRSRGEGSQIGVAAEMTRVTLDVLERTIFSDGLGCNTEELRAAMAIYFETIGRIDPLDLFGVPAFVPRLGRLRARSTCGFSILPSTSSSRRDATRRDATRRWRLAQYAGSVPNDIFGLLLGALDPATGRAITEAEVRSNILMFIAAGHETTANCPSWSLFLLSQSAEWRERVAAEARREIDGPMAGVTDRLVLTRAVVEESIRLYPPIAAISRMTIDPDELAGVAVRWGSMLVIAPYVLLRHRHLWRDPDYFDPGRFLGDARMRIDRFAYSPFGAGMRTCIGSAFALQEATLMLATIMRHFALELAPGHAVWPLLRVTLRPAGGLPNDGHARRLRCRPGRLTLAANFGACPAMTAKRGSRRTSTFSPAGLCFRRPAYPPRPLKA
jgi:cytochrome P450